MRGIKLQEYEEITIVEMRKYHLIIFQKNNNVYNLRTQVEK